MGCEWVFVGFFSIKFYVEIGENFKFCVIFVFVVREVVGGVGCLCFDFLYGCCWFVSGVEFG